MILSEQILLDLLEDDSLKTRGPDFYSLTVEDPHYISPVQMANLYTNSALLVTVMIFLKEELWLQNENDKRLEEKTSYKDFIIPFFAKELSAVFF